jgi:hypothetical protein
VHVADGAEFAGIVGGLVVDDGEVEFGAGGAVAPGPLLEMGGEFGVGDNSDAVNPADGRDVVEDALNHRLASHREEGLGLGEGEGVKARGVARGQNQNFHKM